MSSKLDHLAERNREIGTLLADRAIERGNIGVEVAELEVLMGYLDVPLQAILKERGSQAVRRVVRLGPGEVVQVIATEQGGSDG